jgi:hypothetical protein
LTESNLTPLLKRSKVKTLETWMGVVVTGVAAAAGSDGRKEEGSYPKKCIKNKRCIFL